MKTDNTKKPTTRRGRPKKNDAPLIPWDDIDHLLVCGEEITNEHGDTIVSFPSYRDLGERFDVAHSLIAKYSRQHNCLLRRKDTQIRTRAIAEGQVIARRAADLSVSMDDSLRIIDLAIIRFGEALEEGRARVDTVADLNTLLRLKQLLLGQADSRKAVRHEFSLVELQRRHQEWLRTRESMPQPASMPDTKLLEEHNCTPVNTVSVQNDSTIPATSSEDEEPCSFSDNAESYENHTDIPPEPAVPDEPEEVPVHLSNRDRRSSRGEYRKPIETFYIDPFHSIYPKGYLDD